MAKYKEIKIDMTVTPEMVLKQFAKRLQVNTESVQNENATSDADTKTEK